MSRNNPVLNRKVLLALCAALLVAVAASAQTPPPAGSHSSQNTPSTADKPSAVYKNPSGQDSEPKRNTNEQAKNKAPAGTRQGNNPAPATGTYTAGKKPNPSTGCTSPLNSSPTAGKLVPNAPKPAGANQSGITNCGSQASGNTSKKR